MAKQPNLEKARLESEAYSKMIRDMINSLNSDLLVLKAKDDRIKTIPVEKDDTPKEMFQGYDRSFKTFDAYTPPSADQATKERVKKKFEEIQKLKPARRRLDSPFGTSHEPSCCRLLSGNKK